VVVIRLRAASGQERVKERRQIVGQELDDPPALLLRQNRHAERADHPYPMRMSFATLSASSVRNLITTELDLHASFDDVFLAG